MLNHFFNLIKLPGSHYFPLVCGIVSLEPALRALGPVSFVVLPNQRQPHKRHSHLRSPVKAVNRRSSVFLCILDVAVVLHCGHSIGFTQFSERSASRSVRPSTANTAEPICQKTTTRCSHPVKQPRSRGLERGQGRTQHS